MQVARAAAREDNRWVEMHHTPTRPEPDTDPNAALSRADPALANVSFSPATHPVDTAPRWSPTGAEGHAGDDGCGFAPGMRSIPKFVLRNHLAEQAIERARQCDFSEIERLHRVLQCPYDDQPGHESDAGFPPEWERELSISCSS
jgi:hypothetical protein